MSNDTPICGVCGRTLGRFRIPRGPVLVNVWRHTGDMAGVVPHAATIGMPGRRATVEEMTEALGDATVAAELWDQIYGPRAKPKRVHSHLEEIPAPRVPARLANDDEVPTGARSLAKLAEENGWEVRLVYAIGPVITERYQVEREVESVSVRAHRGGQRVVSVWQREWTPNGTPMKTKRTKCKGCKKLDCDGCELGTGSTSVEVLATWEHDCSFLVTPSTALVNLADVKDAIQQPEAYCERCTEVLGLHYADPKTGYICRAQEASA